MKKLFLRSFVLLLPLLLLGSYFVIEDPMKVIHNTKDPVSPGVLMNDRLFQLRYMDGTTEKYSAFIFGSSRSKAFKTDQWNQHIDKKLKAFHMGVNDESLFGIQHKLQYLEKSHHLLKEVLIVLDHRLISLTQNSEAHIFREHYTTTGESSSSYYQRYVNAFLSVDFLKQYFQYKRTGKVDTEATNLLWDPGFRYVHKTGDIYYERMDQEIAADSLGFYSTNAHVFHEREKSVSPRLIIDDARTELDSIGKVLTRNKTKVKVIITPNYDLVQLHPEDLKYLRKLFGKENVVDYSGENEITTFVGNYYEYKHFKPYIANQLMNTTYERDR